MACACLEKKNLVDGATSRDGDLIDLGSNFVMLNLKFANRSLKAFDINNLPKEKG